MKKTLILIASIATLICLLCIGASAANICQDVGGNVTQTKSFLFSTGGNIFSFENVKLTQTKGIITQSKVHGPGERGIECYGRFYVTVYDRTDNTYIYNNKEWTDKTFTIPSHKIKKNHSYEVTVKGASEDGIFQFQYNNPWWRHTGWSRYARWEVTKTGGNINVCAF